MTSRGRRRQWVEEPEEPFAGLHDRDQTSLAVYGLAATLYPAAHQSDEDEAAELLPWPEGAAEPALVGRFDARLLLDPLQLSIPSQRSSTAAAAAPHRPDLEAELERERWGDLWALQRRRRRGSASPSASSADEETSDGKDHDATGHGYDEAQPRLQGLEPPPPPPVGPADADSGAALLEPGALVAALGGRLPFTGAQLAVMQRTAEFLRRCGEPGAALLRAAAAEDPVFAFLSPDHLWHDFFQGMVEHNASMLDGRPPDVGPAAPAAEESSSGGGGGGDDDGLRSLLGEYMSDQEDNQGRGAPDAVTQALLERVAAAAAAAEGSGADLAAVARQRLAGDPALGFLDPASTQHAAFRAALEDAGLAGAAIDAWTGASPAPPAEPTDPANEPSNAGVVAQAAPITFAAAPAGGQGAAGSVAAPPQWLIDKMRAAAGVPAPPKVAAMEVHSDAVAAPAPPAEPAEAGAAAAAAEAKKADRRRKVRELLERQRQLEGERRQGQAAARQHAEEERVRHLAAISQHKKMFLADDDD